ncbi:MAG: Trp biosynthesis-associated membrane protein [bacterium]
MTEAAEPAVTDAAEPVGSDAAERILPEAVRARREATAAAAALALGGGLALLAGSRAWFTVTARRQPPLASVTADVAGRTVAPAAVGLGVVALAGVVAVLATRATARRGVGAVLALAGVVLVWQALTNAARPGPLQARRLIGDARTGVVFEAGQRVSATAAAAWPMLAATGGLLVTLGGLLVAARGGRWRSLSARYDAPAGAAASTPAQDPASARGSAAEPSPDAGNPQGERTVDQSSDLALWQSLERGEDPTTGRRPGGR